jgi:DNA polymerase III epsilon subunit-like protein
MKVMIFDTETTGLIKNNAMRLDKQPYIVELFSLTIEDNNPDSFEEVGRWESLFSQATPLPEDTVKITGINDKMLEGAPRFYEKKLDLRKYIESHDIVVGHNLTYDMAMVNNEMKRYDEFIRWPDQRICTVEQTEHFKGYRLSLTALHEYLFGEPFKDAHRAETDVRALTRCYIELRKRGEL